MQSTKVRGAVETAPQNESEASTFGRMTIAAQDNTTSLCNLERSPYRGFNVRSRLHLGSNVQRDHQDEVVEGQGAVRTLSRLHKEFNLGLGGRKADRAHTLRERGENVCDTGLSRPETARKNTPHQYVE